MEASNGNQLNYRAPDTYIGRYVVGVDDFENAWAIHFIGDVYFICRNEEVPKPTIENGLVLSKVNQGDPFSQLYFEQTDRSGRVTKSTRVQMPSVNAYIMDREVSNVPMPFIVEQPPYVLSIDDMTNETILPLNIPPPDVARSVEHPEGWNEELGMVVSDPIVIDESEGSPKEAVVIGEGAKEESDTADKEAGVESEAKTGAARPKTTKPKAKSSRTRKGKSSE
jgi:hypothetical protein